MVRAALIAIVLLLGVEFAVRLVTASDSVFNIKIGGFKEYHPTRGTQLKKNYRAGGILINSHGILGKEFSTPKSRETVRILVIGDSVTFHPPANNYPSRMEAHLRKRLQSEDIEVIAAAVPGYSSFESLDWYQESLNQFGADITVIYIGWNDMSQYHPFGLRYKAEKLMYQPRSVFGSLAEIIYLLRVPYLLLGRIEQMQAVDMSPLSARETEIMAGFSPIHYEANLKRLIEGARSKGSVVFLVSLAGLIGEKNLTAQEIQRMQFPRNTGKKLSLYKAIYDQYQATLDRVSAATKTPMIDLRKSIATPADRVIFSDTMHINDAGAERFGAYVAQGIESTVRNIVSVR